MNYIPPTILRILYAYSKRQAPSLMTASRKTPRTQPCKRTNKSAPTLKECRFHEFASANPARIRDIPGPDEHARKEDEEEEEEEEEDEEEEEKEDEEGNRKRRRAGKKKKSNKPTMQGGAQTKLYI